MARKNHSRKSIQTRQSRKSKVNQSRKASKFQQNQSRRRPNRDLSFFERQPIQASQARQPIQASQPIQARPRGIHSISPYMLHHIQKFVGPETTRGYMRPQTLAMLNQNIPSLGRMMFDFLYPGKPISQDNIPYEKFKIFKYIYPGGEEPRITQSTILPYINNLEVYREMMFTLFKEHVRHSYLINKIKPIPLTPQEEVMYRDKLWQMVGLFMHGIPDRENTLKYLEDTTGKVSHYKKFKRYK